MAEDVARAVGAGGTDDAAIMIAGKRCTPRPLSIRELAEVERECLRAYTRHHLQTYSENLDLMPGDADSRATAMRDKIEEASRWDISDLPPRHAYDPATVVLSAALQDWAKAELRVADTDAAGKPLGAAVAEQRYRRAIVAALDAGLLKDTQYKELTGKEPAKLRVGYCNWWITGTMDGMITLIWMCFRASGVTKDEVLAAIGNDFDILANLSREIEHLTAPAVGNG